MPWRPRRAPSLDLELPLSAEAGFVLAQLDGATDLDTLADVTGFSRDELDGILEGLLALGVVEDDAPVPASAPAPARRETPPRGRETPPEARAAEVRAARADAPRHGTEGPPDEDLDEPAPSAPSADPAKTHYALWHTVFSSRTVDERVAAVGFASDDERLALAYDPDAHVVRALLADPRAGLAHARLVAAHHGTSAGLDAVVTRAAFASDGQVLRALLRNPMLTVAQLDRVASSKPLPVLHRLAADREVHEHSRPRLRALLVQAFHRAPPEERADLVTHTEARCLALLSGATFDARTTQILSARPITSALFVQNLAKFRATPPALLTYLLRQPLVRNSPGLRKLVLAHPNTPSDERRKLK